MRNYELGLYEKAMPNWLTIKEKLECTKANGFDFLEISIDESEEKLARLDMTQKERLTIIEDMFSVGVSIRTMCLSGHRKYPIGSEDPNIRSEGMRIMRKAIKFADDIGIRIIQLAGYDVYYEESNAETKKNFEINLKKSVELAAKSGIILAFETMETEFMNTIEKAMEYIKLINSPFLQIYPDCGNIKNAVMNSNKSLEKDFKIGNGRLSAVHLKETVPGKFREIPFGCGHVDFEEVIKISWELGVRKFTIEFWYVGNDDWKEVIRANKEFMDGKFALVIEEEKVM